MSQLPTPMRPMRWCAALLVLAALTAGCSSDKGTGSRSGSSTPADFDFGANNPRKATAFGDSITQGVLEDSVTRNNYPNNLQAMLQGQDSAWRVVNRGQGGERTSAGARRFPGVLAADRPGFALIMEGTNDASFDDDPPFTVANLQRMVQTAKGNKTVPLIGTIPPNFRNDKNARVSINEANGLIRGMAAAEGIVLAEIFDGMNDRSLFGLAPNRDPLHPNERGYQVMAMIWFDAMQRAIPPPGAAAAAPPASPGSRTAGGGSATPPPPVEGKQIAKAR